MDIFILSSVSFAMPSTESLNPEKVNLNKESTRHISDCWPLAISAAIGDNLRLMDA